MTLNIRQLSDRFFVGSAQMGPTPAGGVLHAIVQIRLRSVAETGVAADWVWSVAGGTAEVAATYEAAEAAARARLEVLAREWGIVDSKGSDATSLPSGPAPMSALPCAECGNLAPARPGTSLDAVFCGAQCYEAYQRGWAVANSQRLG